MSKKLKDRKLREWRKKATAGAAEAEIPTESGGGQEEARTPAVPWVPAAPLAQRIESMLIPLALLALMLVLTFRPITQNDFWMHLRIGEDILDTWQIPHADQYSAVAQGRPFVAHEWLSGVFLALVGAAFGPHGFTIMAELVAFAMAALLFFSLPKEVRQSPVLLPLGLVAVYTATFRLAIRPDLFTMLLLAVWAFCIERWRASRNVYFLAAMVPLITLWANLHGAFLFGVSLLVVLAALVGADQVFDGVQRTGERYSRADFKTVALVAAAGIVACLFNPQGWNLPLFSLQMTAGQNFEQVRAVTEWQPTFDSTSYFYQNFPYLVYGCGVWLLMLWSGLLLRFFEVPLFDWVIAGVTTYLSVHQNRFIPYASIFGFPIAMRSWYVLLEQNGTGLHHALSKSRIFKALSLIAIGSVIAVSVKRGFLLSETQTQPLGWGYGSRHPEQEVDYIKQQGLQGVLYNERMPDGAYLIRELYPQVRPVMDMRLDVYGKELCDEYDATKSNREALNQYIQKYGATLALVNKGGWIEDQLRRALGFSTVYEGAERSVMVKRW